MFSLEEWSKIIQRLISLTNGGAAKWTSNGVHGFFFAVNDEVTYVLGTKDDDGLPPYELKINQGTESNYRTLGTLDTVEVTAENDVRSNLFALWDAVERSANNASAIAADLLSQLEALEVDADPGFRV